MTLAMSKQCMPVYDEPTMHYPPPTPMQAGIREVLVISMDLDLPRFRQLPDDGDPGAYPCITPSPDSAFMAIRPALSRRACCRRRGEREIADIKRACLETGTLSTEPMGRDTVWFDTGAHESSRDTAQFIATIAKRQGWKVAAPGETAFRMAILMRPTEKPAGPLRQADRIREIPAAIAE